MTEDKVFKKRLIGFFVISFLILLALMSRLFYFQIVHGEHYQAVSEENRMRRVNIPPPRGEIFDRQGTVLARNSPGYTVSLMDVPEQDEDDFIDELSEILDIDRETIEARMTSQRYRRFEPVPLKSDVDYETVSYLEEKRTEFPGVVIEVAPTRNYPDGKYASHLLGWMGEISREELENGMREVGYRPGDYIGKSGIESVFEKYLRGEEGVRQIEVNRFGSIVTEMGQEEPEPGNDLQLTLDFELQKDLTKSLDEARFEAKEDKKEDARQDGLDPDSIEAKGAAGMVLDPDSGGILSMVSTPQFNPETFGKDYNELQSDPLNPVRNRVLREKYPPGSTFKMVTAVAALEENEITGGETIHDQGRYWEPPYPRNYGGIAHGRISMVEAMAKSSNVYFAELGNRLGIDKLSSWSREFGFGNYVGLEDISGELSGDLAGREIKQQIYSEPQHSIWFPGDTLNAALGQGYHSYTPLQMGNYAAMVANKGIHYRPYLVDKIYDDDEVIEKSSPETLREIEVNERTWELVREGMRDASLPGGTAGQLSEDLPFDVAVKTGTAETGSGREPHSWMVGFAPYDDPEIAFALIVENGGVAGARLTPVARDLIDSYFDLGIDEVEIEEDATGEITY
ncbi:penicillin-binding protein 2 [Natranaerofaba carboxydovora]|uniref:penicillin-binding protein 2 n=1 Tax=Natranaerofaba carboxydovora TaxID=2742683 RepID=UPI001F135CEF|nr:penicillin-binding protein 2 [Natranaerofaba carboxydovora]UMZ72871.1 Peptidoglycan D,D-transpeptidase MrdA [Natranaerofaba carboxydovora]